LGLRHLLNWMLHRHTTFFRLTNSMMTMWLAKKFSFMYLCLAWYWLTAWSMQAHVQDDFATKASKSLTGAMLTLFDIKQSACRLNNLERLKFNFWRKTIIDCLDHVSISPDVGRRPLKYVKKNFVKLRFFFFLHERIGL